MLYLLVVPVPHFPMDGRTSAVESAFAEHLRKLLASLGPRVDRIEVLSPAMNSTQYEAAKGSMACLDPEVDRIRFTIAYPLGLGTRGYCLQLPRVMARIWRAVGRAAFVHAGPSQLFQPFEMLAILTGWLRRRKTIYVMDIDNRRSAKMKLETGKWTYGVYWRRRNIHDRWFGLQSHLARWICSAVFLKGQALASDYGRGSPNVHYHLDCAHSKDMVLPPADAAKKLAAMADDRTPLRACYFGRLVDYKGIDYMLRAIAAALRHGAKVQFDIFGSGEAEASLRALQVDLGLQDVVRFHGPRPYGREFFAELTNYHLLLAAPISEDTPRSAMDAQAIGMGVLAFDTYYYAEIAAQGAGVTVVPWPDIEAMAMAIARLASNRAELVLLGQRGLAFAAANTQEEWLERRAAWTPGIRST